MLQLKMSTVLLAVALLLLPAPSLHADSQTTVSEKYESDVTEEEWSAAIEARDSGVKLKLVEGERTAKVSVRRERGRSFAAISTVIRMDGSVGIYKVVETNDPSFARDVIKSLRTQRYKAPVLADKPVSLRVVFHQVATFNRY